MEHRTTDYLPGSAIALAGWDGKGIGVYLLVPNSQVILVPAESHLQVVVLGNKLVDWGLAVSG